MTLVPAATLLARFPDHLAVVLSAHQVREPVVLQEKAGTVDHRVTTTVSRSLTGSMNEFSYLAKAHRRSNPEPDLLALPVVGNYRHVPWRATYQSLPPRAGHAEARRPWTR